MIWPYAAIAVATVFSSTGALMAKRGAARFRISVAGIAKNPSFLIGAALYGISLPIYLFALKALPISAAYPLTSLNFVWVALLSKAFLHERVDALRSGGIALVVAGVVLIAL